MNFGHIFLVFDEKSIGKSLKNSKQFFLVFDKDYFDSACEISSNFKITNSNLNFKVLRLTFLVKLHTCALQCDPCPGARARAAGDGRCGSRAPELQQCELGLCLESARTALVPVTLSGHAVWVSTQFDWYPTPSAVPSKSCGPLTMLLPTVSGDLAVDAEDLILVKNSEKLLIHFSNFLQ